MNSHCSMVKLGEKGKPIQVLRVGTWHFDDYGEVVITTQTLADMVQNFKDGIRGQEIPVNIEHRREFGALGAIQDLYTSEDGSKLYAVPNYNAQGRTMVLEKEAFMYASLEFMDEWTDDETQRSHKNVVVGLALTNYPRIKRMEAQKFSEPEVWLTQEEDFDRFVSDLRMILGYQLTNEDIVNLYLADEEHETPQKTRDALPEAAFAFPKQRKLLIHKPGNVRAALGRFMQVQGASDSDRDTAWSRLKRAAQRFGITVQEKSWRDLGKPKKGTHMTEEERKQKLLELAEAKKKAKELSKLLADQASPPDDDEDEDEEDEKDDTTPEKKTTKAKKSMSEVEAELAVKMAEATTRLTEMEKKLAETEKSLRLERTTRELMQFTDAVDTARRAGRVTPADAKRYQEEAGKMTAEVRAFLIKDLGERAEIIDLSEIGSGEQPDDKALIRTAPSGSHTVDDTSQLAEIAKGIQASEKVTYRVALDKARQQLAKKGRNS